MSQKLFITDLDGTLLTKEKTVSPRTHDALRDFVSRGNRVVFSSGRSVASVCGVLLRNDLLLPGVIVSAFNGGCIYDLSAMKTLYRTTLPLDLVEELFVFGAPDSESSKKGVPFVLFGSAVVVMVVIPSASMRTPGAGAVAPGRLSARPV